MKPGGAEGRQDVGANPPGNSQYTIDRPLLRNATLLSRPKMHCLIPVVVQPTPIPNPADSWCYDTGGRTLSLFP